MGSAFVAGQDQHIKDGVQPISRGLTLVESPVKSDADARAEGAVRLAVCRAGEQTPLASAVVIAGDLLPSARRPGVATSALGTSLAVTEVNVASSDIQVVAALAYAAARRARILDRVSLSFVDDDAASRTLLDLVPNRARAGSSPVPQERVDIVAHYAAAALVASGAPLAPTLRAHEAEETIKRWLARASEWGFFAAVEARTLTRAQYVYALSNIYQFVRQTTRLAARAIAYSPTTDMRTHFIKHLNGEVNHELIIERDLAHLGEDVAYVRDAMAPNGPTQEFMSIQESMIGYYQDPVLLMASPLAAEGVSAHLDERFVRALNDCIRSWGIAQPDKCNKFFVSHIHTDGGDDGHWEMTVQFLSSCLVDEAKHQFFVRSMRSAMRGTRRLYDSFVDDLPAISPTGARLDVSPARA